MACKPTKSGGYKLTTEVINRLHEGFLCGLTITQACIYAGISRDTYYEWMKKRPDLAKRMELAQLNPFLAAKRTIMQNMGNPDVAKWYLERKSPDGEFSMKQDVAHIFKNAPSIVDDIPLPENKAKK